MAQIALNYSAAQINAAIAKINSLVSVIEGSIVQLYDGSIAIYPRTKAEAVFLGGDTSNTLDKAISLINERILEYLYPKIYQLNEGAGARQFDGFYSGTASISEERKTAATEGCSYKVVFYLGNFYLQELSSGGVTISLYSKWDKIGDITSSESYAERDILFYIYVAGEGSTYYYIDNEGNAVEASATYLLRLLLDKNKSKLDNYADTFKANSVATSESNGLMSADDKSKLDSVDPIKRVTVEYYDKSITDGPDRINTRANIKFLDANDNQLFNAVLLGAGNGYPGLLSLRDRSKLDNYADTFPQNPVASSESNGLMSADDKSKLNSVDEVIDLPWDDEVQGQDGYINNFTERGEYHIHGERLYANDGLPIINSGDENTIDGLMTILDSSLPNGNKYDVCVTQILRLNNRKGGDGHIYVRTGIAATKSELQRSTADGWSPWEKLMGVFEKNAVSNATDLDKYTSSGMYDGMFVFSPESQTTVSGLKIENGSTFLMVAVNGYAVAQTGVVPQVTQLLYVMPSGLDGSSGVRNAKVYTRTGIYVATTKTYTWGNFDGLAQASDISKLYSYIQENSNLIQENQVAIAANTKEIARVNSLATQALETAERAQEAAETAKSLVSITWSELKALRDNSQLVAGTWYRITDYTCTTTQENTRSAGHPFDVIVRADSENKLNEEAFAIQHEGDDYFASSNLSAWKLWYSLDNDTTRFAWADSTNGKGVIYRMIDEWNNDVPYDFKNINFKRYIIEANNAFATNVAKGGEIDVVKAMLQEMSHKIHTDLWYYGQYVSDVYPDANPGARYVPFGDVKYEYEGPQVLCLIDENNYGWFYTFHNEDKDASLLKPNVNETIGVCDNTIKDSCYVFLVEEGTGSYNPTEINAQSLNNIVFLGNSCYSNSFGNVCYSNSFGNVCYSNSFGNGCYSNSFGNGCNYNSFGNDCYYNSFGNNCNSNSFGNICYSNSFGNNCNYNSFGNDCYYNSFGNDCNSNSFGNGCNSNSFGNNCNSNSFGNGCNYIMFASDSSASTKYNYYQNNNFGDGCNYIVLKGAGDANSSKQLQNYNFAQGVQGTSSNYLIIDGVRNLSYETKVAKNSSGELKIYCEADLIQ